MPGNPHASQCGKEKLNQPDNRGGLLAVGRFGDLMVDDYVCGYHCPALLCAGYFIFLNRNLMDKEMIGLEFNLNGDRLIIAGSGNVALHIYKIAAVLGYSITIIDHRAETLTRERFPEARALLLGDIVELLGTCEIAATTSIVLVTHNHEFDEAALQAIIKSPARYIGILGNKRKVTAYLSNLKLMGIADDLIARVHLPIGLDLGGELAAEIALAAVAEIQAVKYGRSGGFVSIKHIDHENEKHDELF